MATVCNSQVKGNNETEEVWSVPGTKLMTFGYNSKAPDHSPTKPSNFESQSASNDDWLGNAQAENIRKTASTHIFLTQKDQIFQKYRTFLTVSPYVKALCSNELKNFSSHIYHIRSQWGISV